MKKFDEVELNEELEELAKNGIHKGCYGTVVGVEQSKCLVFFLNRQNSGDYAFAYVDEKYLTIWDGESDMFASELEEFMKTHRPEDKPAFEKLQFKEYDLVELTVEKEKYARKGVHKGMTGVILVDYAIESSWAVTFSDDDGEDIAELIIPEKYLKKVE